MSYTARHRQFGDPVQFTVYHGEAFPQSLDRHTMLFRLRIGTTEADFTYDPLLCQPEDLADMVERLGRSMGKHIRKAGKRA